MSDRESTAWHSLRRSSGEALLDARVRFLASDPGLIALRRGARGALSFALTLAMAWAVSALTGQALMSMALGFSVSIFGAVVPAELDTRARAISTVCLIAAAGTAFTTSALIQTPLSNHLVFVALVFAVVYARRWGDRANATGFGAFVSFFFGAFLAPPASALPWHLLGLALAAVAVLAVQVVLLPQRPAASLARILRAITRRLSVLLGPLERYCAQGCWRREDQRRLGRELLLLEATINTARAQLDAMTHGWRGRMQFSFALFELQTATERLAWVAQHAGGGECTPETRARVARLRLTLGGGHPPPPGSAPANGPLGEVLEDLAEAHARLLRESAAPTTAPEGKDPVETAAPPPNGARFSLQTRLAVQAAAACLLAILGGELLSPERWYWAVITVFVMFTGTASRGDALYRSLQRLLGTFLGVFAGIALVSFVGHDRSAMFVLLLLAIFFTYYFFTDRFVVMTFCLTVMLALLFALLGRFSEHLLWLRVEETAVGAVAGILVASLLLPRATQSHVQSQFVGFLDAARELVDASLGRLLRGDARPLAAQTRHFEQAREALRAAIRPLRLDRFGSGARLYEAVAAGLQATSYWLHELSLAARASAAEADDRVKRALASQRERFGLQLQALRDGALIERPVSMHGGKDDFHSVLPRPSPSPDQRIETAARALEHVSRALTQVAWALREGTAQARLFRF
jgi:uncharacterized membrane protein YccC